jgi:hypothetical protein
LVNKRSRKKASIRASLLNSRYLAICFIPQNILFSLKIILSINYLLLMNFISKIILSCLFLMGFAACQSSTKDTSITQSDSTSTTEISTPEESISETTSTTLTVSSFTEPFPEERGCGCDLSRNEADKEGQKYIFVSNDETEDKQVVFMKINNVMVRFVQTSFEKIEGDDDLNRNDKTTFISENSEKYTLEVERTCKRGEYTVVRCIGTIKVTNQKGESVIENLVGECAC